MSMLYGIFSRSSNQECGLLDRENAKGGFVLTFSKGVFETISRAMLVCMFDSPVFGSAPGIH